MRTRPTVLNHEEVTEKLIVDGSTETRSNGELEEDDDEEEPFEEEDDDDGPFEDELEDELEEDDEK